jgi:uncharacterized protein (TIGR03083 family)
LNATPGDDVTVAGVEAVKLIHADVRSVLGGIDAEMWSKPSGCSGWSVQDLVAHLTSNLKETVEPSAQPDASSTSTTAEEAMDALVAERRCWTPAQLMEEYERFAEAAVGVLTSLQEEPAATTEVALADLGTYPMHLLADAFAFDHYCHLRIDLLSPRGPVDRVLAPPRDSMLRPGIEWMLAGLPQMCAHQLVAMTGSVILHLTGPGGGIWTVHPPREGGLPRVEDRANGVATVTSAAHDFVSWGTTRSDWRGACTLSGDTMVAETFLDAIDII